MEARLQKELEVDAVRSLQTVQRATPTPHMMHVHLPFPVLPADGVCERSVCSVDMLSAGCAHMCVGVLDVHTCVGVLGVHTCVSGCWVCTRVCRGAGVEVCVTGRCGVPRQWPT